MLEKSIYYKNAAKGIVLEVLVRAGESVYPYCYPNSDMTSLNDYTEVEALFYRLIDGKRAIGFPTLESIIGIIDGGLGLVYKNSFADRAICIGNISNTDPCYEENGLFDSLIKPHGYKRVLVEEAHSKMEEKMVLNGTWCRSCNNFSEYAEADKIINDGKHTCWSCASHPERRRKGLETPEQVALVLKHNNIK